MEDLKVAAKKWQTIYPAYLNSRSTVQGGRRVPKEQAVENPTCEEISEVLTYLKLTHLIQPDKAYPRDWTQKGRVKVLLKDEHGQLFHAELVTSIFAQSNTGGYRAEAAEEAVRVYTQAEIARGRRGAVGG